MRYKNLILNIEKDPAIYKLFSVVVALIPQIPALEKLIEQATKNGPITVDFVGKDQTHTNGAWEAKGQIYNSVKTIEGFIKVVKQGQTFTKMFETLVFELCNAKNPNFELFHPAAISPSKFDKRDDYAYATELAEYSETHLPSRAILKEIFSNPAVVNAFKANGINLSKDDIYQLTSDGFQSFQAWWGSVNNLIPGRDYSHSDIYRRDFDRFKGIPTPIQPNPGAPTSPVPVQPIAITKPALAVKPAPVAKPAPDAKQASVMDELQKRLTQRLTKTESVNPTKQVDVAQKRPLPPLPTKAPAQKPAQAAQKPAQAPAQRPAQAPAQKPACFDEYYFEIRLPAGAQITQQELEMIKMMALQQYQEQFLQYSKCQTPQKPLTFNFEMTSQGQRYPSKGQEVHCHRHRCHGYRK